MHLYSVTVFESLLAPVAWSFEQRWPHLSLSLVGLCNYLFQTGRQGAEIRGYLSHLCEKIMDAKFLEDMRYRCYISLEAVEQYTRLVSTATYTISEQHSLRYEDCMATD